MGKIPIITRNQKIILDELKNDPFLCSNFYFTGGTALSLYHLKHRYSEDLDFFSLNKFDNEVIYSKVDKWSQKYGYKFSSKFSEVVYMFFLEFPDKKELKIDFGYYPYKQIHKGKMDGPLSVDSLRDIATNKLLTINQRTDVKDFVDLYYLLKKYTIWDLIYGLEAKFHLETDQFLIASDFLKAEDFTFLPKMIKPLKLTVLQSFFRNLSLEIGRKITK